MTEPTLFLPCVACGKPACDDHLIHGHGPAKGARVPVCSTCHALPALDAWALIQARRDGCDHSANRFSICGFAPAEPGRGVDEDGELDAVDFCPDCWGIRLWGIGWMDAPEPSDTQRASLLEDWRHREKCECGVYLDGAESRCLTCMHRVDGLEDNAADRLIGAELLLMRCLLVAPIAKASLSRAETSVAEVCVSDGTVDVLVQGDAPFLFITPRGRRRWNVMGAQPRVTIPQPPTNRQEEQSP